MSSCTYIKVRIVDLLTWRLDMTEVLVHDPVIHKALARARLKQSKQPSGQVTQFEEVTEILFELHRDDTLPLKHRAAAQFSQGGQYLATYQSTYPSTLWVWHFVDGSRLDTVIALTDKTYVTEFLWHEEEIVLTANLSSGGVLVWTPERTVIHNRKDNPWPFTAQEYLASR